MTRARISCIQTGFNLVSTAVVCAILESISGLDSSVITEPRYLKLVTVSRFCPFILISKVNSFLDPICIATRMEFIRPVCQLRG